MVLRLQLYTCFFYWKRNGAVFDSFHDHDAQVALSPRSLLGFDKNRCGIYSWLASSHRLGGEGGRVYEEPGSGQQEGTYKKYAYHLVPVHSLFL